jgi:LysM repeat protein
MGDEDQYPRPKPPFSPEPKKPGSTEAGLHESAGSAVGMPEWADSLSHGASAARSRVDVDLAKRLQEEEARIIRERAEAARRAAEEAARRKAAEEAAQRQAAQEAVAAKPRRVSKLPSILAAAAVILLGAFVGTRLVGSESAPPPEAATPFPLTTPTPSVPKSSVRPTAMPQRAHLSTYVVKPGDTLESIADKFGRTPLEISQANGAFGGLIRVRTGQVINIP